MNRSIAGAARALLATAAFGAFGGTAFATPDGMRAAMETTDLAKLHTEATADSEKKLASAVEQSWTHHDKAAVKAFTSVIPAIADPQLKAAAYWELSSVQFRLGDFKGAVKSAEAGQAASPATADNLQTLAFMKPLIGEKPTRAVGKAAGRVEVKRDVAGLMRSEITVGGASIPAILDTGANFSTINETQAKRMGLRMLDAAVSVGSVSKDAVASKLGVADRLSIGGAVFSNVVFIVLPDSDLSFANGAYTIDAILGMPVFFEMGRIGLEQKDGKEWFVFGRKSGGKGKPNILLNGFSPMLQASVQAGGKPAPIVMLIDSGAQVTSLNTRFATEFAALLDGAATVATKLGGAGGTVDSQAQVLPTLNLTIGVKTVTLKAVNVDPDDHGERYGAIGKDALGSAFTIDFDAGRLEVE